MNDLFVDIYFNEDGEYLVVEFNEREGVFWLFEKGKISIVIVYRIFLNRIMMK